MIEYPPPQKTLLGKGGQEICGESEKFVFEEEAYYIAGLRRRNQKINRKDSIFPVLILKSECSDLAFPCRFNPKNIKEPHENGVFNYICGHKCSPKNFVLGCKFNAKFQSIYTSDNTNDLFWTVENWKIFSMSKFHSCEQHVRKECGCLKSPYKYPNRSSKKEKTQTSSKLQ